MSDAHWSMDALKGIVSFGMRQFSLALGIAALAIIGSVYFIVDMSLRGIEKSIEITNKRIDDLDRNLTNQFSVRTEALEKALRAEFTQTRELIRRGSLDALPNDPIGPNRFAGRTDGVKIVELSGNRHLILGYQGKTVRLSNFLEGLNQPEVAKVLADRTMQKPQLALGFQLLSNANSRDGQLSIPESSIVLVSDPVNLDLLSNVFGNCIVRKTQSRSGDVFLELNENSVVFEDAGFACRTRRGA
jgi:hypothetical protein